MLSSQRLIAVLLGAGALLPGCEEKSASQAPTDASELESDQGQLQIEETGVFSAAIAPAQALNVIGSAIESVATETGSLMLGDTSLGLTAADISSYCEQDGGARPLKTVASEAAIGEVPDGTLPETMPKESTIGQELSALSPTYAQKQSYCALNAKSSALNKGPFFLNMILCLMSEHLTAETIDSGKQSAVEADFSSHCKLFDDMPATGKLIADVTYASSEEEAWDKSILLENIIMVSDGRNQEMPNKIQFTYKASADSLAIKFVDFSDTDPGNSAFAFTLVRGSEETPSEVSLEHSAFSWTSEQGGSAGSNDRTRLIIRGQIDTETGKFTKIAEYQGITLSMGKPPEEDPNGGDWGQISTITGATSSGLATVGYYVKYSDGQTTPRANRYEDWASSTGAEGICLGETCEGTQPLTLAKDDMAFLMPDNLEFIEPKTWVAGLEKPLVIKTMDFSQTPVMKE